MRPLLLILSFRIFFSAKVWLPYSSRERCLEMRYYFGEEEEGASWNDKNRA